MWLLIFISETCNNPRHASRAPQPPKSSSISASEALYPKDDTSSIFFTPSAYKTSSTTILVRLFGGLSLVLHQVYVNSEL